MSSVKMPPALYYPLQLALYLSDPNTSCTAEKEKYDEEKTETNTITFRRSIFIVFARDKAAYWIFEHSRMSFNYG